MKQAALIRGALGIRKRQEINASTRERLSAFAFGRSARSEATWSETVAASSRGI